MSHMQSVCRDVQINIKRFARFHHLAAFLFKHIKGGEGITWRSVGLQISAKAMMQITDCVSLVYIPHLGVFSYVLSVESSKSLATIC